MNQPESLTSKNNKLGGMSSVHFKGICQAKICILREFAWPKFAF